MSLIRYTEEGQKRRLKQLGDLRKRLVNLKNLESYKEDQGWKYLTECLRDFIENEKNLEKLACQACEVGGYWNEEDKGIRKVPAEDLVSDIRVARKGQLDYQFIIDLIQNTTENINHVQSAIDRIEKTFKEAKESVA